MKLNCKIKKIFPYAICFQILMLHCLVAWAEEKVPELTITGQRTVYNAQVAIEKKEYLKAEKNLKQYIAKHPGKPNYLVEFTLGNTLTLTGRDKEALVHYKASVELYSGYAPAWQNMGKIYFDLKEYEKAGDCLLKKYQLDKSKNHLLLYNAAVSFIMAEKPEKALPHLDYLVSRNADTIKIEWVEAFLRVCMDLQRKGKAFKKINRLLHKNTSNPDLWKIMAQFHLWQNDYKSALAALTIRSYLEPVKKREDIMLMGDLSSVVGIPIRAAAYYESLLEGKAKGSDYKKLASAYIAAHRQGKALEVLNLALKKKTCPKLFFILGRTLYYENLFNRAGDAFDKCTRLNPENGQAYLMKGYCFLKLNENKAACAAFKKAAGCPKQKEAAEKILRYMGRSPMQ